MKYKSIPKYTFDEIQNSLFDLELTVDERAVYLYSAIYHLEIDMAGGLLLDVLENAEETFKVKAISMVDAFYQLRSTVYEADRFIKIAADISKKTPALTGQMQDLIGSLEESVQLNCRDMVGFDALVEDIGFGLHASTQSKFLAELYEIFTAGEYLERINALNPEDEIALLYKVNFEYIIFHKRHPKFGKGVIECGNKLNRNAFCFFASAGLTHLFAWLDSTERNYEHCPAIPTYYAKPEDRYYGKTWED